MPKLKALLIGVDYVTRGDRAVIRLILKRKKFLRLYDPSFLPYFYVEESASGSVVPGAFGGAVVDVQKERKVIGGQEKEMLKVLCRHPRDVSILREALRSYGVYEHQIAFGRRYLIDKELVPMNAVEIEREGKKVMSIKDAGDISTELNTLVFDIETYNPAGMPRENKDPAIIITHASPDGTAGALTWRPTNVKGAEIVGSEREMIERFCSIIRERDIELIVGYNSSAFDIPYLMARAIANDITLGIGRNGKEPSLRKHGLTSEASIEGRVHFDAYYAARFLSAAQALKVHRFVLEEVYSALTGKEKLQVDGPGIWKMWDGDRRDELVRYAMSDVEATTEIFRRVFPLQVELARLTKVPISEVSGSTSGQLVEALLMSESFKRGLVIPSKPGEEEVVEREEEAIEGAYVRMPKPGLYDRIAVFDFRGLYPSLICAYNISPDTLNCKCCGEEVHISPAGHRFCKKKPGFIPSVLRELIDKRTIIKKRLKSVTGRELETLNARQLALRLLANTFYGYLRYVRSRWYSKEAAESVTAWGREHIQNVAKLAEEEGFGVLYSDTDSLFLLLGDKKEEDALSFVSKINKELPDVMELELEDFYTRGIFVAKKNLKGGGAKKKYALINSAGKIKIRGFELVRRDWSAIAKKTQKEILSAILKEGSKEKAIEIVREKIEALKSGKVPKEDLTIWTQLKKKKYEIMSPELAAAEKAKKKGVKIPVGSVLGYIITKGSGSISERAELTQFANDYDPDYYINNQLLPAVLRILGELGYTEEDIKFAGKQSSLGDW